MNQFVILAFNDSIRSLRSNMVTFHWNNLDFVWMCVSVGMSMGPFVCKLSSLAVLLLPLLPRLFKIWWIQINCDIFCCCCRSMKEEKTDTTQKDIHSKNWKDIEWEERIGKVTKINIPSNSSHTSQRSSLMMWADGGTESQKSAACENVY